MLIGSELVAQVLRRAVELPVTGPRGGDLTPLAELIGRRLDLAAVRLRMFVDGRPVDHTWPAGRGTPGGGGPGGGGPGGGAPGGGAAAGGVFDGSAFDGGASGDVAFADVAFGGGPDGGPAAAWAIVYRGEEIGGLLVSTRAEHPVPARTHRALGDIAGALGAVLAAAAAQERRRAAADTCWQATARIADARTRAAADMESERHALERDLHDGAQLHLVSLQMAAAVVEHRLAAGELPGPDLHEALADLGARLERGHTLLVETAAGITPPLLRTAGLEPALAAALREAPGMALEAGRDVRSRRYPPPVESAVYFACLEAVSNAQKHASGASVRVRLHSIYQGLAFTVEDDGPGMNLSGAVWLRGPRDRLASVGGSLSVTSTPGAGTRICGVVPF
ncbi:ATP-binding protein [Frankia sp. R43]|uniref:sensor histidine kinase n=1 Tax=Frankia sp. R43 TaxID=269536 RepID=UPI0006CA045D